MYMVYGYPNFNKFKHTSQWRIKPFQMKKVIFCNEQTSFW